MMETSKEKKLSLKILVDVKRNSVVFAEADKEFVDFLLNILSLPLSTVTKVLLLNEKGMVGCLGALYKSIESLGVQYFGPNVVHDSVLKPRVSVSIPLLSLHDLPASNTRTFHSSNNVFGGTTNSGFMLPPEKTPGFVKDAVVYMVMDNLEVKPMSFALIKSLVRDLDVLEEKQVEVGLQEGLAILKASLETSSVLTTVFLKKI